MHDTSLTSMEVFLVYSGGSSVFGDEDDEEEDDNTTRMPFVLMVLRLLFGNTTIRMIILRGCRCIYCTKSSSWDHDDGCLCV